MLSFSTPVALTSGRVVGPGMHDTGGLIVLFLYSIFLFTTFYFCVVCVVLSAGRNRTSYLDGGRVIYCHPQ